MSRRAAIPVTALALLVVGVLLFWFAWALSQHSSTARAQGTEDCANAQIVNRFTGTGNQGTEPFETTGPFRVTYDLTAADSANLAEPSLTIYVYDQQSGSIVADASQEGEGTGEIFVDVPPGTYTLSIFAINGEYTVPVEQCEGGAPSSTNPDQPKTEPKDQPKTQPTPQPQPPPQPNRGELMKAGGPPDGPVPTMPDERCPREFPIKKSGACYR